jgi:hypothetical protein
MSRQFAADVALFAETDGVAHFPPAGSRGADEVVHESAAFHAVDEEDAAALEDSNAGGEAGFAGQLVKSGFGDGAEPRSRRAP